VQPQCISSSSPSVLIFADVLSSVQDDIMASLKMCKDHLFKVVHPFNRANLFYEVQYMSPSASVLDAVSDYILKLHKRRGQASTGIVYCRTRAGCDEMAQHLRSKGIGAKSYHRGLPCVILFFHIEASVAIDGSHLQPQNA
jgi:superfamily II DNA helicase RecQ